MKYIWLLLFILINFNSYAIDSKKCSDLLNNGLFKKYKYMGIGEAYWKAITEGTKKDGFTSASSESSTVEPSTASLDTKYTSNIWTSETQSSSSWGACSLFALNHRKEIERNMYIVQNFDKIMNEIVRGNGDHLKVVTFYSLCNPEAYPLISDSLRRHFAELNLDVNRASTQITKLIDSEILNNQKVLKSCVTL